MGYGGQAGNEMNRIATLLLAVVLLVGSVSAVPLAGAAGDDTGASAAVGGTSFAQTAEHATNVTPGQRLAAVVGVGQAEFEGEVDLRAYGVEYAMAQSNASKAEVVHERIEAARERFQALEQRQERLQAARANGSISEGEFQARMTELTAESEAVRQVANASEARANALPADALEEAGVNVSAIQTLRQDAAELTGPEVAAIARSIAGDNPGRAVGQGPPVEFGAHGEDRPGAGMADPGGNATSPDGNVTDPDGDRGEDGRDQDAA